MSRMKVALLLLAVVCLNSPVHSLDCSTFDPSKIKLVTFDVFAALMDVFTSLEKNIPQIVPFLPSTSVKPFVNDWVYGYADYAGHKFTKTETGNQEPFTYLASKNLDGLLVKYGLSGRVVKGDATYTAMMETWGNLIPWNNTGAVLTKIASKFAIAPLSNGDAATLKAAMTIFAPGANISYIFSSDWPVGSFKPDKSMYYQLSSTTGISPENILHVAGAPSDGRGARDAGYYSALLRNPPEAGTQPCFSLADVTDLPVVLGL